MPPSKKKKKTPIGEYRNLRRANGFWCFEVKTKDGWKELTGLSNEVSLVDAQQFAQNTAYGWRKK